MCVLGTHLLCPLAWPGEGKVEQKAMGEGRGKSVSAQHPLRPQMEVPGLVLLN